MKNFIIEPAQVEDIAPIAAHMRPADVREVWASHRHTPEQALETSLAYADKAWVCRVEGVPAFMWGVSRTGSILDTTGIPWLLGTPDIKRVQRAFIRLCPLYVEAMQEGFERLENYVHAGNKASIRWLEWCGFTIEREVTEIMNGEDFYLFWRTC